MAIKQPELATINENIRRWNSAFKGSLDRSKEAVRFVKSLDQWSQKNLAERENAGKKSLTFPLVRRVIELAQAKVNAVELDLDVKATSQSVSSEQTKIMNDIMRHIVMNKDHVNAYNTNMMTLIERGYSVYFVDAQRKSQENLSLDIVLKNVDLNRCAMFFDPKSTSMYLNNGSYGGFVYKVSGKSIRDNYSVSDYLKDDQEYEVVDYFFSTHKKKKFIKLDTNEYVREDLVNNRQLAKPEDSKKQNVKLYCHTRIVKLGGNSHAVLKKAEDIGLSRLPIMYNPALTFALDDKIEAMPLVEPLKDTQMLINYVGSQIANQARAASSDKIIVDGDATDGDMSLEKNLKNYNYLEGMIKLKSLSYKIEPGQQLSPALLQAFEQFSNLIDKLAGSLLESDAYSLSNISGVAVDKMREPQNLLQSRLIKLGLETFNEVGSVVQEYLPRVYHEQRTLHLQDDDQINAVVINQSRITDSNDVNSVVNFSNDYMYEIKADVNEQVKKQNSLIKLKELYEINPQIMASTLDIYCENLDLSSSDELARVARANINPLMLKYRNKEITLQQYQEAMEQQESQPPIELQMQQQELAIKQEKNQIDREKNQVDAQKIQAEAEDNKLKRTVEVANIVKQTNIEKIKHQHNTELDTANILHDLLKTLKSSNAVTNTNQ